MKKLLTISIALNILFFILIGFVINKNGGISYLKSKFGLEASNEVSDKPIWYYKNYRPWKETKLLYDILPNDSSEIIFVGTSITFGCEWAELFSNPKIKNRGIGCDITEGVLERLPEVTESRPAKIFLEIGTNDLALKMSLSEIYKNYEEIIDRVMKATPKTKIYIQSVLPVNNRSDRDNDSIIALNKRLEELAKAKSAKYINLFDSFIDTKGNLNMELSLDGLHLNGQGYLIWKELIEKDVSE